MDNREKQQLQKKTNRLIDRGRLDGKKIILFGASMASNEVKKCLKSRSLKTYAVIDNDPKKTGRECMGLSVERPETLLCPYNNTYVILVYSLSYYREIMIQLEKLGYHENKQLYCLNTKSKEALSAFLYHVFLVLKGLAVYKKLIKKYPKDCTVFVAPYTGTGDVYLAGLFFFEYLRRHNISQYVFVVVSGACCKVAQMFGIQNVEVMCSFNVKNMIDCGRALNMDWPVVIFNDCWTPEYTNLIQWIRGYKDLSFDKMYRHFVFGFTDDVPYHMPPPAKDMAEADRLFEQYGLTAGKTVILSPYSNTLFEPPDDFWKAIVQRCREKGYTVCTNSAGKDEPSIEGTIPIFFPLGLAIDFMNKAGCFIGVRSGLCDIISSSSCKKIILYEKDGSFYKCSPLGYFSLIKMGLCNDAVELEYREDLKHEVITEIFKEI